MSVSERVVKGRHSSQPDTYSMYLNGKVGEVITDSGYRGVFGPRMARQSFHVRLEHTPGKTPSTYANCRFGWSVSRDSRLDPSGQRGLKEWHFPFKKSVVLNLVGKMVAESVTSGLAANPYGFLIKPV